MLPYEYSRWVSCSQVLGGPAHTPASAGLAARALQPPAFCRRDGASRHGSRHPAVAASSTHFYPPPELSWQWRPDASPAAFARFPHASHTAIVHAMVCREAALAPAARMIAPGSCAPPLLPRPCFRYERQSAIMLLCSAGAPHCATPCASARIQRPGGGRKEGEGDPQIHGGIGRTRHARPRSSAAPALWYDSRQADWHHSSLVTQPAARLRWIRDAFVRPALLVLGARLHCPSVGGACGLQVCVPAAASSLAI